MSEPQTQTRPVFPVSYVRRSSSRRRRGPGWLGTAVVAALPAALVLGALYPPLQDLADRPQDEDEGAPTSARIAALEAQVAALGARLDAAASPGPAAPRSEPTPAEAEPEAATLEPPAEAAPSDPVEEAPAAEPLPDEPLARARAVGHGPLNLAVGGETIGFELVHVPPGVGLVGLDLSDPTLPDRAARALFPSTSFSRPRVRLEVDEGFFLGAGEVTNGQYLGVLKASGVDFRTREGRRGYLAHLEETPPGWRDLPVRYVSWSEAAEFCQLLTELVRRRVPGAEEVTVRLPSELEWEFAAAGPGERPRRFPWGEDPSRIGALRVSPAKAAGLEEIDVTPAGVRALGAGLAEWCLEPWHPHRWGEAPAEGLRVVPSELAATEPGPAQAMACRGGSYASTSPMHHESASRQGRLAGTRGRSLGFRILVTDEAAAE